MELQIGRAGANVFALAGRKGVGKSQTNTLVPLIKIAG